MSDVQVDNVIALALQLSPAEQARLMERLAAAMVDALSPYNAADDTPWTDEAIAGMMQVEPKTGAEIVAAGLLGGWADMDIEDGAAWVNEQKRKRQESRRW